MPLLLNFDSPANLAEKAVDFEQYFDSRENLHGEKIDVCFGFLVEEFEDDLKSDNVQGVKSFFEQMDNLEAWAWINRADTADGIGFP